MQRRALADEVVRVCLACAAAVPIDAALRGRRAAAVWRLPVLAESYRRLLFLALDIRGNDEALAESEVDADAPRKGEIVAVA